MGKKKPMLAVMAAVLLAITTTAAPITATAANEPNILEEIREPEAVASWNENSDMDIEAQAPVEEASPKEEGLELEPEEPEEGALSENGLSENGLLENDLLDDSLSENNFSDDVLSGNGFQDNSLSENGNIQAAEENPKGETQRQNSEAEMENGDFLDLMDQETLERALIEGTVAFIPNEGENADEEEPRAQAGSGSIIEVASREVGVSGSPNKYTYWLGSIGGTYAYAWCHAFVSWCGAQAGAGSRIPRTASCFYGSQEFKAQGKWKNRISGYVPKTGDIIYFDWNADGGYDHVGIVNYVSAGRVHTIEGNAGNAVRYDGGRTAGYALTDSQIIGYGTPDYGSVQQAQGCRGCLDETSGGVSRVKVRGWAFDENAPRQALDVHVYVGGPAGSGAPGYAIKANKSRPDVGAVYAGVGDSHGFDASIAVSRTGLQPVYVYAIGADKKSGNPLIGTGQANIQADTQKPEIFDVKVSDVSVEGYTVTCQVADNVGIKKVAFPSWHESKTGNEAVWFEGAVKNGEAKCFVDIAQLGNLSGKYTTHIYAYDTSNNYAVAAAKAVSIDHKNLGQYKLQNISSGFIAAIENEKGDLALTGQEDGLTVTCQASDRAENQIWEFQRTEDGSYVICLKTSGAYLGASPQEGKAFLTQEKGQRWRIYAAGENSYYLNPVSGAGYALELPQESEEAGAAALTKFGALAAQKFKVRKLSTNVKSITLNHTEITLTAAEQTAALVASVEPKQAADEKILWSSSDVKTALVDKKGLVTAVNNGTAQIAATTEDGSISVLCKVNVKIQVTDVKLNKQQLKFTQKGEAKMLSAKALPDNAYDHTVTWVSSDKKVAKVAQSGKVTAVASGTAAVTAQTADGKKKAVCNVTVQIPKVGAGGVVKKGGYTYSADFIPDGAGYKTAIYRQKGNGAKKKIAQVGAKAYLKLAYGKNLFYEKVTGAGKRNLYVMDTGTFKKKSVRVNSTVAASSGKYLLLKPYAAKPKPQPYRIYNAATGKTQKISSKCLAAKIVKSKVYYVEAVSGSAAKGWKAKARSCSLLAGNKKDLTGKITINECQKLTDKKIVYRSGKTWYQYSFATGKQKKIQR